MNNRDISTLRAMLLRNGLYNVLSTLASLCENNANVCHKSSTQTQAARYWSHSERALNVVLRQLEKG